MGGGLWKALKGLPGFFGVEVMGAWKADLRLATPVKGSEVAKSLVLAPPAVLKNQRHNLKTCKHVVNLFLPQTEPVITPGGTTRLILFLSEYADTKQFCSETGSQLFPIPLLANGRC